MIYGPRSACDILHSTPHSSYFKACHERRPSAIIRVQDLNELVCITDGDASSPIRPDKVLC
eukprot:227619-Pelagomonas_calceolata.AAC.2